MVRYAPMNVCCHPDVFADRIAVANVSAADRAMPGSRS